MLLCSTEHGGEQSGGETEALGLLATVLGGDGTYCASEQEDGTVSSLPACALSYCWSLSGFQLWKRSGVSISPLSSPASSRPQTPEWPLRKAR